MIKIENKCECKWSSGSTRIDCCNICGLPLKTEVWHLNLHTIDLGQLFRKHASEGKHFSTVRDRRMTYGDFLDAVNDLFPTEKNIK